MEIENKDYRKYLLPQTISSLGNIELKAKLVVEGFITGLHKSPYHGFSIEFAEHRQYRPGDEIRHIDWKVYGRSNRFYVKQFEEETNLRGMVAIDSSASMKFASKGNISKFEYASYLGAALIYLMMNQRDAAGLALYNTEIQKFFPPRSKQSYLTELLKSLENTIPSEKTGTAKSLHLLAERVKNRSLVIVISDFFDDPNEVVSALKHFRHNNHEVLVFQLLDPRELDFDFGYKSTFIDMETNDEIVTEPYQIKAEYQKLLKEFTNKIEKGCREANIDYSLIDTSTPFDKALKDYLNKRVRI